MGLWPFSNKKLADRLKVDLHSHLIPRVDDGVKTTEEVLSILQSFESYGYEKVITTPHIYPGVYPNTEAHLLEQFQKLQLHIQKAGINISFELGAEYYMHGELLQKVKEKQALLSFTSERFLLIETSFHDRPMIWDELFFELQFQGYKPILAHPERYTYVSENISLVEKWRNQGIRMQMNISSLLGGYGKAVQKIAKEAKSSTESL